MKTLNIPTLCATTQGKTHRIYLFHSAIPRSLKSPNTDCTVQYLPSFSLLQTDICRLFLKPRESQTIFIFLFPSFLSSRATNYMWRCAANRLEIASVYTQNFGLCFTSAIWQRGNSPRFSKSSISWAMRSRRDCPMPSVRHFWRWVS